MSTRTIRVFEESQVTEINLKLEDRSDGHGVDLIVVDNTGKPIVRGKIARITEEGKMQIYHSLDRSTGLEISPSHRGIVVELPE
jgi:hypothetical protein